MADGRISGSVTVDSFSAKAGVKARCPAMAAPLSYFSGFDAIAPTDRARLMADAVPFALLHGNSSSQTENPQEKRGAIVCLHGFTAMPYGVRPVAEACHGQGFDVIVPLQPGHGFAAAADQGREFSRMTAAAMLAAAREEVKRARDRYGWVGLYGDSMGGAIALILASEGLIDACATTAPALKLPFRGEVLCALFGWLNFSIPKRREMRFYAPCYPFENSRAGRALLKLSNQARRCLDRVTCPTFVAHSRNDRTISPIVVDWLRDRVAGPLETQWFDRSGHVMPLDVCGPEVSRAIATFFQEQFQGHHPHQTTA